MEEIFDQTGTDIARTSGLTAETIRAYTRNGLLDHRQLSNGIRVYKKSAVAQAKKIHAQNLARRSQKVRMAGG
jgi:DNA-binding transcriptional MerR regulator